MISPKPILPSGLSDGKLELFKMCPDFLAKHSNEIFLIEKVGVRKSLEYFANLFAWGRLGALSWAFAQCGDVLAKKSIGGKTACTGKAVPKLQLSCVEITTSIYYFIYCNYMPCSNYRTFKLLRAQHRFSGFSLSKKPLEVRFMIIPLIKVVLVRHFSLFPDL